MKTDFKNMDVSIKILNEEELIDNALKMKQGELAELAVRLIKNVKEQIQRQDNPLDVNRFFCTKCDFTVVATLIGAPSKCHDCGSKDFLERAVVMTKDGKVKNPHRIKFNPDLNTNTGG